MEQITHNNLHFVKLQDQYVNLATIERFWIDFFDGDGIVLSVRFVNSDLTYIFTDQEALDIYSHLQRYTQAIAPAPAKPPGETDGYTIALHGHPLWLHKDADSDWGVTVMDLPGCYAAGETLAEALENAGDAIRVHLRTETRDRLLSC
jgi:predicted RNase H-like HicB family nuclease